MWLEDTLGPAARGTSAWRRGCPGLAARALPARCAPATQGEQAAVYRDCFEPRVGFLGFTPLLTATSTPSTVEEALSR